MNTASNNFQNIWDALLNKDAGEDSLSTDVDEKTSCAHKDDPDEMVPKRKLVETAIIRKIESEELAKIKLDDLRPPDYAVIMDRFLSSGIRYRRI